MTASSCSQRLRRPDHRRSPRITYELSGGRLALDGYLARTEKGCWTALGDLVAQENWFAAFLEADPYYELDEPRLTLSDDEVTLVMIDRAIPEPDRPLRRTRWIVSAYMRDGEAFGALIDDVYARHGRIDGVVHGAGVIEDKLVKDKTPESFDRVFGTKAASAVILSEHLKPVPGLAGGEVVYVARIYSPQIACLTAIDPGRYNVVE
jgi:hypothetical protein